MLVAVLLPFVLLLHDKSCGLGYDMLYQVFIVYIQVDLCHCILIRGQSFSFLLVLSDLVVVTVS